MMMRMSSNILDLSAVMEIKIRPQAKHFPIVQTSRNMLRVFRRMMSVVKFESTSAPKIILSNQLLKKWMREIVELLVWAIWSE